MPPSPFLKLIQTYIIKNIISPILSSPPSTLNQTDPHRRKEIVIYSKNQKEKIKYEKKLINKMENGHYKLKFIYLLLSLLSCVKSHITYKSSFNNVASLQLLIIMGNPCWRSNDNFSTYNDYSKWKIHNVPCTSSYTHGNIGRCFLPYQYLEIELRHTLE